MNKIKSLGKILNREEQKKINGGNNEQCIATGGASYMNCTLQTYNCMGFVEGYGDATYRKSVWNCPNQNTRVTYSDVLVQI